MLPPGSYILLTRGEEQRANNVLPGSYADSEANSIANSDPATFDASAFIDPSNCDGTGLPLAFHWLITYPAAAAITNPYTTASGASPATAPPSCESGPTRWFPQTIPPVDFKLIVTSPKTGLSTTVDLLSQVSESTLSLSVYNSCKGQAVACPTCTYKIADALPATEPTFAP